MCENDSNMIVIMCNVCGNDIINIINSNENM